MPAFEEAGAGTWRSTIELDPCWYLASATLPDTGVWKDDEQQQNMEVDY